MCTSKSQTELIIGIYNKLLTEDMVRQYGEAVEFRRDFAYLQRRVRNEGFSFLTKTLPVLAKAIDKALVTGTLTTPTHFKCRNGFPTFLRVLLERVFNSDGTVKIEPCISAVRDLRQILFQFYKYELGYDDAVIAQCNESFIAVDTSLGWEIPPRLEVEDHRILNYARMLLGRVFSDVKKTDLIPGHGPGAVATGEKAWEKMHFKRKYTCIDRIFPYQYYFFANAEDLAANVGMYFGLDSVPSGIARGVYVPKDSRGPRFISEEPLEFMYMQQGLKTVLVSTIEQHPLTRGHVNFRDQTINRELAVKGSISGDIVTLDMKEASDRIALWLVEYLFTDNALLKAMLLALRTEATELPGGPIHLLRKFAPMGSALCFPVESVVHWSIGVASLVVRGRVPLSSALKSMYVYGDDIILEGQNHTFLLETFEKFGMKFNADKCCTSGIFRESCGADAVLGQEVQPIKFKKLLPSGPYDATGYESWISYANQLWDSCYYSTAQLVESYLQKLFGFKIPYVPQNFSVPGFVTTRWNYHRPMNNPKRYNRDLQRWERRFHKVVSKEHIRGDRFKIKPITGPVKTCWTNDRCEYQRKLITKSDEFVAGVYTVPHSVKLKQGWTAWPYGSGASGSQH